MSAAGLCIDPLAIGVFLRLRGCFRYEHVRLVVRRPCPFEEDVVERQEGVQ